MTSAVDDELALAFWIVAFAMATFWTLAVVVDFRATRPTRL